MPPSQPLPSVAFEIVGCVLAGGLASRMGGGDKALMDLNGKPILAHVLQRLGPQVTCMVLNANGDAARFSAFGMPVVADTVDGFAGPLAGILAGLRWAERSAARATHVLTVSGDAPFFPYDLVSRLRAAVLEQPQAIAIAASGDHVHPVIGLWPIAIADDLERDLNAGERTVSAWCRHRGAIQVEFAPVSIAGRAVDPFFNANTPLELAEARLIAQRLQLHSPVIGIAGWKNSGKTTLVTRLVEELVGRGRRVSTIKFSHHEGTVADDSDKSSSRVHDTCRHAAAGAYQVAFAGPLRWAIVESGGIECGGGSPVTWHASGENRDAVLGAIIAHMAPADLIVVEGYKAAAIPKIEVRRLAQADPRPLAEADPYIFAIASDHPVDGQGRWVAQLDSISAIADQLERLVGMR